MVLDGTDSHNMRTNPHSPTHLDTKPLARPVRRVKGSAESRSDAAGALEAVCRP